MNAYEQRRLNDAQGLTYVYNFGWLRTAELGKLLWPDSPASRQAADRLARSWVERDLVIVRQLPEGAGRALVLAAAGVRLLAEHGITASSGKDIGRFPPDGWLPPASWRHDLIAHGVLCELKRKGFEVISETQLKRMGGGDKVPDGLAIKAGNVLWLEVENARKSGPEMKRLAESLIRIALNESEGIGGHEPTAALVAFLPTALDERGHALSHQARVRSAVAKYANEPVRLLWSAVTRLGSAGVGAVKFSEEVIEPDSFRFVLDYLNRRGWSATQEGLTNVYQGYVAIVWKDEYQNLGARIEGGPEGVVASIILGAEAELSVGKSWCVAQLARLTTVR